MRRIKVCLRKGAGSWEDASVAGLVAKDAELTALREKYRA